MTLEEMTAQRDALLAARFRGVRTVEIEGRRITYQPVDEVGVGWFRLIIEIRTDFPRWRCDARARFKLI